MQIRFVAASLAALLLGAAPSSAMDEEAKSGGGGLDQKKYQRSALYLQLSGGLSLDLGSGGELPSYIAVQNDSDVGGAVNASVGLQPYRWFAFELAYGYQSALTRTTSNFSQTFQSSYSQHILGTNFKFYAPLPRIQPYLLMGVAATFVDSDFWGSPVGAVVRPGAGVDVYLTNRLAVMGEAVANIGTSDPVEPFRSMTFTVGVKYKMYSR